MSAASTPTREKGLPPLPLQPRTSNQDGESQAKSTKSIDDQSLEVDVRVRDDAPVTPPFSNLSPLIGHTPERTPNQGRFELPHPYATPPQPYHTHLNNSSVTVLSANPSSPSKAFHPGLSINGRPSGSTGKRRGLWALRHSPSTDSVQTVQTIASERQQRSLLDSNVGGGVVASSASAVSPLSHRMRMNKSPGSTSASGSTLLALGGLGRKGLSRMGSVMRKNSVPAASTTSPNDKSGGSGGGSRKGKRGGRGDDGGVIDDGASEMGGDKERFYLPLVPQAEADEGDAGVSRPFNVEHDLHVSPDLADLPPAWLEMLKTQGLTNSDLLIISSARKRQQSMTLIPLNSSLSVLAEEGQPQTSAGTAMIAAKAAGSPPSRNRNTPPPPLNTSLNNRSRGHGVSKSGRGFDSEKAIVQISTDESVSSFTQTPSLDLFNPRPIFFSSTSTATPIGRGSKTPNIQSIHPDLLEPHTPTAPVDTTTTVSGRGSYRLSLSPGQRISRGGAKRLSDQLRGFREIRFGDGSAWAAELLGAWEEGGLGVDSSQGGGNSIFPLPERIVPSDISVNERREPDVPIPFGSPFGVGPSSQFGRRESSNATTSPRTPPSAAREYSGEISPKSITTHPRSTASNTEDRPDWIRSPPPPPPPRKHLRLGSNISVKLSKQCDNDRLGALSAPQLHYHHHHQHSDRLQIQGDSPPARKSSDSFGIHYSTPELERPRPGSGSGSGSGSLEEMDAMTPPATHMGYSPIPRSESLPSHLRDRKVGIHAENVDGGDGENEETNHIEDGLDDVASQGSSFHGNENTGEECLDGILDRSRRGRSHSTSSSFFSSDFGKHTPSVPRTSSPPFEPTSLSNFHTHFNLASTNMGIGTSFDNGSETIFNSNNISTNQTSSINPITTFPTHRSDPHFSLPASAAGSHASSVFPSRSSSPPGFAEYPYSLTHSRDGMTDSNNKDTAGRARDSTDTEFSSSSGISISHPHPPLTAIPPLNYVNVHAQGEQQTHVYPYPNSTIIPINDDNDMTSDNLDLNPGITSLGSGVLFSPIFTTPDEAIALTSSSSLNRASRSTDERLSMLSTQSSVHSGSHWSHGDVLEAATVHLAYSRVLRKVNEIEEDNTGDALDALDLAAKKIAMFQQNM